MTLTQFVKECSVPCGHRYRVGVFTKNAQNQTMAIANFYCSQIELNNKKDCDELELSDPKQSLVFVFYIQQATVEREENTYGPVDKQYTVFTYTIRFDNMVIAVEKRTEIEE